ncbi:MAG: NAD-dependent epimerase/dehydratase family protein [Nocardioidaceae bacterium]
MYISSETVLGFHYGENPTWPTQLPIDETSPTRPNDAYGLSKLMGERILEAAASTGRLTGVSLRPSWVQYEHTYQSELGPIVDDPAVATSGLWCYTDGNDLADAVARSLDARIDVHEAFFIVNPDSIGGHDVNALGRKLLNIDFSGVVMGPGRAAISSAKAEGVLGWRASRSWSDFVSTR